MKTKSVLFSGAFTTAIIAKALVGPAPVANGDFRLSHAVPNDVFFYVAGRSNPERAFIDEYWDEVLDAFKQSGISEDIISMIAPLMSEDQTTEMERLKERARQLVDGVDWEQLAGTETAFAERFDIPDVSTFSSGQPPILMPDMVWMFRGTEKGASHNYKGLVAILEAIADEINNLSGSEALTVAKTEHHGAHIASMDLLTMAVGAPKLPLQVALHKDMVIIAMREKLFADVLDILSGTSAKKALGSDARFKAAFKELPTPEDTMTFYDMKAMMKPMNKFFNGVLTTATVRSVDNTKNSGMSAEASDLNSQALQAYRTKDYEQALKYMQEAHAEDGESSVILYNLACFSSLVGDEKESLAWLEKAIDAGFHAPAKISNDSDFENVRDHARFKELVERARKLAVSTSVKDVVINGSKEGEAYRLLMQAWRAHGGHEYERGLELAQQAHAVAPDHSRVLYALACFHSVLGHEDRALDYLEKAVDSGYYCPKHIGSDLDLEKIREHKRFRLVSAKAREKAMSMKDSQGEQWSSMAKGIYDRITDAVSIMDYTAAVETTDGHTTKMESITTLVPDAKDRPIYAIFGKKKPMTNFAKFLPKETQSFAITGGFDANELYSFIEDSVKMTGTKGKEVLAKWEMIQQSLGVDIRKDVLGWIDGDSISVTLANGRGSVSLMKVKDEDVAREKVAAAIQFASSQLTNIIGQMAKQNPSVAGFSSMLSVRTSPATHEDLKDFENIHFSMSPQPMVWGVAEGHLVFGSSADAAALCLNTARGKHPNIKSNERVMNEAIVPDGEFVAVTLTDKRGLGQELAAVTGMLSMGVGMAGSMIPKPELRPVITKIAGILGKASGVVRKIDFFKSSASAITFDGQRWRTTTVTHYLSPEERLAARAQ